jgi:sulfur carrier protein
VITVNGRKADWRQGMTVRDVLQDQRYTSPRIIVQINGELVRQEKWDSTIVRQGDDVRALHMIAGGL